MDSQQPGGIELDAYKASGDQQEKPVNAKEPQAFVRGAATGAGCQDARLQGMIGSHGWPNKPLTAHAVAHDRLPGTHLRSSRGGPVSDMPTQISLERFDCRAPRLPADGGRGVPPDVNTSERDYSVKDGKIYFGLAAIKGCGGPAAEAIARGRKSGPYASLFDFCRRVDPQLVNRATIETLIKAGAFDSLGTRRAQLMAIVDRAVQSGVAAASDRRHGQLGLFDTAEPEDEKDVATAALPDIPEWEDRDKLAKERVLALPLQPPARRARGDAVDLLLHTSVEAAQLSHRTEVMLGGMLAAIKHSHTKNPKPGRPSRYAMWDLEDKAGIMRCILWPEQFAQYGELVQPDAILVVLGSIDKRPGSEEANLIVNELIPLDQLQSRYTRGVKIRVSETEHGEEKLDRLYEILRGYPGNGELQLLVYLADGRRVPMVCRGMQIDINREMWNRVEELLGPGNFKLLPATIPSRAGRNGNGRAKGDRRYGP